jgi:S1-C subfamily serine protease
MISSSMPQCHDGTSLFPGSSMSDERHWAFPPDLQPQQRDLGFDLAPVLDAVVGLRAEIPSDAFTAPLLGTERAGNGVVIGDDGLVLTIGYLVTEAEALWLSTNDGQVLPGHPLAYDFATGFGLVMPLGRLDAPAIPLGSVAACAEGTEVLSVGHGGREHALRSRVFARRPFAGYWEYLLDEAVFVTPAHPQWGGSALVDPEGRLAGIGSLLVEEVVDGNRVQGNMYVPADLLPPILDDLLRTGRSARPPRPWLGMYTSEAQGELVVGGLAPGGPAERAGVREGDLLLEAGGRRVHSLAEFYRRIWSLGPAGVDVPLVVAREGALLRPVLRSADRNDFLRKPRLH